MWVEVENLHCNVVRADNDEMSWLSQYLSISESKFSRRRDEIKAHHYVVTTSLLDKLNLTFPTGLFPLVRREANAEGFKLESFNKRQKPCEPDPSADLRWLRDYQLASVEAVCKHQRGLIRAPTASGKGEVIVALTLALPCKWLFLVHRTTLVQQQAERYDRRTGLKAGRIGEGQWSIPKDATFVCASFQTLHAGLRKGSEQTTRLLEWAEGIAVDECHTAAAETLYRVCMSTPNAFYRIGFSGTPLARGDKRSMFAIGALGRIIHEVKTESLVERGFVAKPKIRFLTVSQKSDRVTWAGVYRDCIVRSMVRNRGVVEAVSKAAKPCLVFVREISHGKILEREILQAGIHCEFVWGTHSTDSRKSAIRRLEQGKVDVLVCSVVFNEGVDIPTLRSVVIASGGKSVIEALQRIGRGMRVTGDKNEVEVWDIYDEGCGCKKRKPEDDGYGEEHPGCRWLEEHTRRRLAAYASEGHETVVLRGC